MKKIITLLVTLGALAVERREPDDARRGRQRRDQGRERRARRCRLPDVPEEVVTMDEDQQVCGCGRVIERDPPSLVAPAGWCAPSGVRYDWPEPAPMCSDCKTRMLMLMEVGIDPGRDGENLRVPRGGITCSNWNTI